MKRYYYVILMYKECGQRFVTGINNASKLAYWNEDEVPLTMSKSSAEDLAFCLGINGFPAFVLESFYKFDDQPFTVKGGDN